MEDAYLNERLAFPATIRNRDSIANVLSNYIPSKGLLLEIASGSGEHGVFFQKSFPSIIWQTSDPEEVHRKSISSWISHFLLIYGPFFLRDTQASQSNVNFDQSLRMQNPKWGLRHLDRVDEVALKNGFNQEKIIAMPANNLSVIYKLS